MVESKVRGWIYIVAALLAGWFAWTGKDMWAILILALSMLISGYHHISSHK